jgi:hypothetical protein
MAIGVAQYEIVANCKYQSTTRTWDRSADLAGAAEPDAMARCGVPAVNGAREDVDPKQPSACKVPRRALAEAVTLVMNYAGFEVASGHG